MKTNNPPLPRLLESALELARRGFHVIPLYGLVNGACECDKPTCEGSAGKHPRIAGWQTHATADEQIIRGWFHSWPNMNVGLVTGERSGVLVLDVDPRHGGDDSLNELEANHGPLPSTPRVLTGGGGTHIFFEHETGTKNSVSDVGPGLDVRADGGLVGAAGNLHLSGRYYVFDPSSPSLRKENLAKVPAWLLELMKKKGGQRTPQQGPVTAGGIADGSRNTSLLKLAGFLLRNGRTESQIFDALLVENKNCCPPLDVDEVRAIAHSVCRYAPGDPMLTLPLTDVGNSERLVALHGDELSYVAAFGWVCWKEGIWSIDDCGGVMEFAKDTIRQLAVAAALEQDNARRKALLAWVRRSESLQRINAMVELARSHPQVARTVDAFDTHPLLLNFGNCTLDLSSGSWKSVAHRKQDLLTKHMGAVYDPTATCPEWDAFLNDVLGGSNALVEYVQRAVGYTLTGLNHEHVMLLLIGLGRNGKSTFMDVLRCLFGSYATIAEFSTFLERKNDSIRNDLARLRGARLVAASEVGAGRRLDEALVKQLTGGDQITARFLRKEFFEYSPQFTIWLSANARPVIHGNDRGIWRRIRVIPFDVTISASKVDKMLGEKLRAELPGILQWALRGLLDYQSRGALDEPPEIVQASEDYKEEMDTLLPFIEEKCSVSATGWVASNELYSEYIDWCRSSSQPCLAQNVFGYRLRERGFKAMKKRAGKGKTSKQVRGWGGLELRRIVRPMGAIRP